VPQIEVTFDIDANGITHVSAKDLGTGKEQKIRITSSSGLSEQEIQQMVKDAEVHAEEDRKKREAVDARNNADSMIYSVEKSLKDFGEKLGAEDRKNIEDKLQAVRDALKGEDVETIKRATDELKQASFKIAEVAYAQAGQSQQAEASETSEASAEGEDVEENKK
jgi:molecular chaperone DnaK